MPVRRGQSVWCRTFDKAKEPSVSILIGLSYKKKQSFRLYDTDNCWFRKHLKSFLKWLILLENDEFNRFPLIVPQRYELEKTVQLLSVTQQEVDLRTVSFRVLCLKPANLGWSKNVLRIKLDLTETICYIYRVAHKKNVPNFRMALCNREIKMNQLNSEYLMSKHMRISLDIFA